MRPCLLAVLAAGLVLGGCGEREIEPPLSPVALTIDNPGDGATVDDESVQVSGRVNPPDSVVRVNGNRVGTQGGSFATTVPLEAGTNVIDIQAGAPKHPGAMTAVRVTRLVKVEVPDLSGLPPDEAADQLRALGLTPQLKDVGSLLDDILGGDPVVCGTDPDPGTEVSPGTKVTLGYSKVC